MDWKQRYAIILINQLTETVIDYHNTCQLQAHGALLWFQIKVSTVKNVQ